MHKKIRRLLSAAVAIIGTMSASSQYHAGVAIESIEPDSSSVSLALGGYGAPREGRFTLTWHHLFKLEPVRALTALDGTFYAINTNGQLVASRSPAGKAEWKTVNDRNDLVTLTSGGGTVYAVNSSNKLLKLTPSENRWHELAPIGFTVALAHCNGHLYGINDQQQIFVIEQPDANARTKIVGDAANAISLAGRGSELYALRSDNSIWKTNVADTLGWLKIARHNGYNYKVSLKHIGFAGDRALGVDAAGNIYMAAHNSRGDLTSRALAIRTNNNTAVIVGVDLVGIRYDIVNEIKDSIFKRQNIPQRNILINVSHTHFAPVTQSWSTWQPFNQEPDSQYLYGLVKSRIIQSIEKAVDNMKPANLFFSRGSTRIGRNRSSVDGETPYDDAVDVVTIRYTSQPVPDVLVLTGCHPVFPAHEEMMYTVSANYPGVMRRVLEEKKVAGTALFLQGCAGDINPREPSDVQTGTALALDAITAVHSRQNKLTGKISGYVDTVDVPVTPMPRDEIVVFKNNNLNKEGDVSAEKNVRWAEFMLKQYEQNTVASALPVYVQTINIGNWKLVGLSREVVTDYSLSIKKLWPEKFVSVAGYCNDVSSYLPVKSHIERHTYEGDDSSRWYGEQALFPSNVLDIILAQIKNKNN